MPLVPELAGMDIFKGTITHSHNYRLPELYRDQTVVCLGAAASGQDLSLDLATVSKKVSFNIYAPNFEEVMEAYWFGSVCPSVRQSVCYACTLSRTNRDRILKFGMWDEFENQEDPYLFSCSLVLSLQSYCPFQRFLLHCKPMEACEQNISRTA